jgi:hypothetical protein
LRLTSTVSPQCGHVDPEAGRADLVVNDDHLLRVAADRNAVGGLPGRKDLVALHTRVGAPAV